MLQLVLQYFWNFEILIAIFIAIFSKFCNTYCNTFCNTFIFWNNFCNAFCNTFCNTFTFCNNFWNTFICSDTHYVTLILRSTCSNILIRSNTCLSTIFQYNKQFIFFNLCNINQCNMQYLFIIYYCLRSFSFLRFRLLPFFYMRENFLFYSSILHVRLILVNFPKVLNTFLKIYRE